MESPYQPMGKSLLTSKTFWINVVAIIGMIVTSQGWVVEPDWLQYEAAALAVLNIVLRLITGEPITGVVKPSED